MSNRRNSLIALRAALFTPGAVFAQAKKPPVVIGWRSAGPRSEAGRDGLAEFKKEFANPTKRS